MELNAAQRLYPSLKTWPSEGTSCDPQDEGILATFHRHEKMMARVRAETTACSAGSKALDKHNGMKLGAAMTPPPPLLGAPHPPHPSLQVQEMVVVMHLELSEL